MAILRINCGKAGLEGYALPPTNDGAPALVMIHGYKYDPAHPQSDPHRSLYSDQPVTEADSNGGRILSWPRALGVGGLCVAYGWRARAGHLDRFLREGRNGFAAVYRDAERAGLALADLIAALTRARSAPVDMIAHSLGARVALAAVRALAEAGRTAVAGRLGRLVLLAPAAFASEARATMDACARAGVRGPEVYCVLSRANAPYDRLFELVAPWGQGAALGRAGLGARRAGWLDLDFDDPRLVDWAARRGVALGPAASGPCHWSVYARSGAMNLHRAILNREAGFGPEEMRASGAPVFAPRPARPFWRRPTLSGPQGSVGGPLMGPTPGAA